jgi:hypothetical protein
MLKPYENIGAQSLLPFNDVDLKKMLVVVFPKILTDN